MRELPSLKHIKNLQTVLVLCTKLLAIMQISNAKEWKQLHTNETTRQHTFIINVVIGMLTTDKNSKQFALLVQSSLRTAPQRRRESQ